MKDVLQQKRMIALAVSLTLGLAGCKARPPISDAALTASIQQQLSGDSAIAGQQIAVTVQQGVATLNGVVLNDAQRTIAARDAAGVSGVKLVQNALSVGTASASVMTPAAPPEPVRTKALDDPKEQYKLDHERERAEHARWKAEHPGVPVERMPPDQQAAAYSQGEAPPPPPVRQPPPPPPAPTFRNVTVQGGEALPVRMTQTLDSASTQEGSSFSGVVASDVVVDGLVAIPAGSTVSGQVDTVHEAGHFKGSSQLTVSLSSVDRHGDRISVTTDPYTVQGNGRGKNTLEKTGIGAAGGALLGGLLGGGRGAAIGAGVGGAGGAGVNAVTRGQQVQIPSETIVRFRLTNPITVRVRTDKAGAAGQDEGLQHRPGL